MSYELQLLRIHQKLSELKRLDGRSKQLFGATTHNYALRNPLSLASVTRFEETYAVRLPPDYVAFMTQLGNGGAGPFYGLVAFEDCLLTDLDSPKTATLSNPAEPFPFTAPWNMDLGDVDDEDLYEQLCEEYYADTYINGTIRVSDYGCAIRLSLVVNGAAYGTIWTDDRAHNNGIHPSVEFGNPGPISFLDWYEQWLDNSLAEAQATYKPWWKC